MTQQKWEYKVHTTKSSWKKIEDEEIEEALNNLAKRGWEPVSVSYFPGSAGTKITLVMRRPTK